MEYMAWENENNTCFIKFSPEFIFVELFFFFVSSHLICYLFSYY